MSAIDCILGLVIASMSWGDEPAETFLRDLPPGLFLRRSIQVPANQAKGIAIKLGGEIERLSNSILEVHGRTIQVNAITAPNESAAQSIFGNLSRSKPFPLCLRKGRVVVEFVAKDLDTAIALKTAYELGLLEKPRTVRYRVTAELATVEKCDYMVCNPLFNQFLALRDGQNQEAARQIGELASKLSFGRSLTLRSPAPGDTSASYDFQPAAAAGEAAGAIVRFSFDQLPSRQGVPYVTVRMEVTVPDTGLSESPEPPTKSLTNATQFWPSDDPKLRDLAEQITRGKSTNDAKAQAILEWLRPGKNLQYSGQTGSRWGAAKVLEQKFGHCWDFADCFVTLSRAAGVPSRQVAGWLYGSSGHVWAEFYSEGKGWQQVDPTGGGQLPCGIYHIPYFTSEDGEMPIVYLSMPKVETLPTN